MGFWSKVKEGGKTVGDATAGGARSVARGLLTLHGRGTWLFLLFVVAAHIALLATLHTP
jgi:hypothetical protein